MTPLEHYLRPPKRTLTWLLATLVLFVILAAGLAVQALDAHKRAANAELRATQLRVATAVRPVEKKTTAALEEEKKWSALQIERNFDWPGVFAAVESAGAQNIELLTFKPEKGNRLVLLGGEARDQKSLMEFLDVLSAQPTVTHVHLTHQQRKTRGQLDTVIFEIKARIVE